MTPDEIARILDDLGQRLGPTGAYVFELAIRQSYINAVANATFAAGAIALAFGLWAKISAYRRADWRRWNALPDHEKRWPSLNGKPDALAGNAPALALYLIPIGLLAFSAMAIRSALTGLLNPEYAALTDILSRITGS